MSRVGLIGIEKSLTLILSCSRPCNPARFQTSSNTYRLRRTFKVSGPFNPLNTSLQRRTLRSRSPFCSPSLVPVAFMSFSNRFVSFFLLFKIVVPLVPISRPRAVLLGPHSKTLACERCSDCSQVKKRPTAKPFYMFVLRYGEVEAKTGLVLRN
ncbi:hypothetical protein ARMSODRAFT_441406 [Armillaria solidipes]|uniref:Uncharacterized protein n=1 Tax=Armillaria solidipes TaxID=1076256 RepID=A0A2H3B369_9AGAR|nr:hypothetical protein ARMSODRAFT_441406 [Armillaria solidipes]